MCQRGYDVRRRTVTDVEDEADIDAVARESKDNSRTSYLLEQVQYILGFDCIIGERSKSVECASCSHRHYPKPDEMLRRMA